MSIGYIVAMVWLIATGIYLAWQAYTGALNQAADEASAEAFADDEGGTEWHGS